MNLWNRLNRDQGLQIPRGEGLEERVFETFNRMYEVFERDRRLIPAGQFCEVHYEDLVQDPVGQMRRAYEELALGDFDGVAEQVRRYFADKADYKKNRFEMTDPCRAEIGRRWGRFWSDSATPSRRRGHHHE